MSTPTAPARRRGWQIGSLAGVPVYLGRSWVVVAAVITLLFGPVVAEIVPGTGSGAYVVAFGFAVLLLLSVLVHEAAHALVARVSGYRVRRIVADFWGGHTAFDGADSTPGRAAAVAVAGPLANAALAAVGWAFLQAVPGQGLPWLLLTAFTTANAFVAAFNLLPGLPLDGGFLVDSLVWRLTGSRGLGTLVAGWCGRLLVLALAWWVVGVPLLTGAPLSVNRLLWAGLIGAFLWWGATSAIRSGRARRLFERTTVASVLRPVALVAQDRPVEGVPWQDSPMWLVVGPGGLPTAVVDPRALADVPAGAAGATPVSAVAQRQPTGWVVDAETTDPVTELVVTMQTLQTPLVAVRGPDGRVAGVVLAQDL